MILYSFDDVARGQVVNIASAQDERLRAGSGLGLFVLFRTVHLVVGVGQGEIFPHGIVFGSVWSEDGTNGREPRIAFEDGIVNVVGSEHGVSL